MRDLFEVRSAVGAYNVEIGIGLACVNKLAGERDIVLCDEIFASTFRAQGLKVVDIIASETAKNLDQMAEVVVRLRNLGANRDTRLLVIGGGIIQDVATFVASIYMRGIRWDYLPTTLLGMVDSCVGGKSSINVGSYKNLVGNFYPPKNIQIDLKFVETLNSQQRAAGLFEAAKICFASSGDAFATYLRLAPSVHCDLMTLQAVVSLSLRTKRWFIEIDEFDCKERLLLNFGHTFAHAIEGAGQFGMPHGIAVGVGMLAALEFAVEHESLDVLPMRAQQLKTSCEAIFASIPTIAGWARQAVNNSLMGHFESDKKHTASHYVVIAPDRNGQLQRLELTRSDETRWKIHTALTTALSRLIP